MWILPAVVENGVEERANAIKGYSGDGELGGELVSPSEEEIGDEGDRRVRVGAEPLDYFWLEF